MFCFWLLLLCYLLTFGIRVHVFYLCLDVYGWLQKAVKNSVYGRLYSLIFKSSFRIFLMKTNVRIHKAMRFLAIWDLKKVKVMSKGMFFSRVRFRVIGSDIQVKNHTVERLKTVTNYMSFFSVWEKRHVVYRKEELSF